jgi:hypothetical protein
MFKPTEMGYSPAQPLEQNNVWIEFSVVCRRGEGDMPRAINTTLVAHTPNAIVTTAIFLFQMAILEVLISDQRSALEIRPRIGTIKETHMRKMIKSEAVAKAK